MYQVIDAAGRTLTLEDDEPCPPGCTLRVSAMFMDARAGASPPAGKYFMRDNCGRVAGICDIAGELRRVGAAEDYGQRLAKRP